MTPTVSVLLRVTDGGAALLRTADALSRQRGVAIELALIRTDGAAVLAESIAVRTGARIFDVGGHPGAALNAAIGETAGDLVAVIPEGWLPASALLERAAAVLAADAAIAAVAPGVTLVGAGDPDAAAWGPPALDAASLLADPGGTPPVFVFRRKAWQEAGFDEQLDGLVEYEFWLRLALAGQTLRHLPASLVSRDAGAKRRRPGEDEDHLRFLRQVLTRHQAVVGTHMRAALVEREVAFGRTREGHRLLLARRDADLAELDRLRADAAHHRAYLEHHGASAVDWGDLRRVDPVSRDWGYDRGTPVDRRYIETFLASHSSDVHGAVLEIQEDDLTRAFGGPRVTTADVLDVDAANARATVIADLRAASGVEDARFDCIILTQTLHVVDDMAAALGECYRMLGPGGVLLATFPAASRVCLEYGRDGDFWRLTPAGARQLVETSFAPAHTSADVFGNVLTNVAFLHGLAAEELTDQEYAAVDPYFPALTGIRARKTAAPERAAPRGVVLLYHRVAEEADVQGLAIAPVEMARHLAHLRSCCTVMPLEQLLRTPPEDLPERPVAISVDDGYLDNLTTAAPLLSSHGMAATFFCTTRWLTEPGEYWWDLLERVFDGNAAVPASRRMASSQVLRELTTATPEEGAASRVRLHDALVHATLQQRDLIVTELQAWSGAAADPSRRPMLAEEVRQLSRIPGMAIGAHTVNHLCLEDQPPETRRREMLDSRAALEAVTERPVETFAYPYGALNRDVCGAARQAFSWSLSCDALALPESFDAARIARLEAGCLGVQALARALDRLFDGESGGPSARLTQLPR
ncbi:MAG: trifunctional glycosyltransferase/class I SAM-dependent methyltransferase/polysaccharide deacetylase [Acidobacteriota bacterium]